MRNVLQKELFTKYPKLLKKDALEYGISCGDGWYWLIDELCGFIQSYIDLNNLEQIIVFDVKQKFGGLRFYTDSIDPTINGAIRFAESLSMSTCEECGSNEDISRTKGYIKTLCSKCIK